jgi:hypothetical protein
LDIDDDTLGSGQSAMNGEFGVAITLKTSPRLLGLLDIIFGFHKKNILLRRLRRAASVPGWLW